MPKNPDIEAALFAGEIGQVPEIDLHGEAPENAVHSLDAFLNQQFMQGSEVVRIIHGRGHGKLRELVHKFLKKHALVADFRDSSGLHQSGGVTVAALHRR